jgi:hypothetical protein
LCFLNATRKETGKYTVMELDGWMQPQHFTTNIFEQFGRVPVGIVPIATMESGGTIY